jgi:hypothetical protein
MSKPLDLYLSRITPWQSTKPNFVATVSGTLQPVVTAGAVVETLPALFDLDTAIGAQLDATGQWVGPSRNVPLPIPGAYFAWSTSGRGWGQGVWKGPYAQQYGITQLDDTTYRRLLQAVVMSNHWDGTIPGMQAIYDAFFVDPATLVFIQDKAEVAAPQTTFAWGVHGRGWNQAAWRDPSQAGGPLAKVDVRVSVCIAGKIPANILLGLLAQNALRLKPAGVTVDYRITSVDSAPVFGWGKSGKYIGGWGKGAWGVSPDYLLSKS